MFRYDGPIFEALNKLADMLILGAIWAIMCIPIFTIGASTTAAYYVAFNQLDKKDGYIISRFFKSFRVNFKQATLAYLILLVVGVVVGVNIIVLSFGMMKLPGIVGAIFLVAQYAIMIEILIINTYIFALLSKIEFVTIKDLFISAAVIGNKHFVTTILNAMIIVAIFFMCLIMPFCIIFSGGLYIICSTFLVRRVLKKYRPEMFDDDVNEYESKARYQEKIALNEKLIQDSNLDVDGSKDNTPNE